MSADIRRIEEMEAILNECVAALGALNERIGEMEALRERMIRLFSYYGSEAWYEDREGELPAEGRAGVLSEDLVYDAVTETRDTAFRMLELATDILKNRI